MEPDQLLDGLNEAQARAVQTAVVPLCIVAGAGSGKTRVLTRRIAYRAATGQHDPERVLALTFTRKAAGELSQRLRALGLRDSVVAGTFHSVAYAQLRARWADRNITPPALLDRKVGFVARLLPSSRTARTGRDTLALDVTSEIEWAKARRVGPEQYPSAAKAAGRTPPLEARQMVRIMTEYEAEKRTRRMVDFDDLLSLCVRDLENDPTSAAAQRWRFRHFFVDEYQDVNPLQQALLEAWLGDRSDLCVVGDPNQAIYAWNGADARYLNDFTTRWERGEVVRLTENYRSSPQVLAAANAVLGGGLAAQRAGARGDAARPGSLRANRSAGPIPTIRMLADEKAEAAAIARAVRDHHAPGSPWSAQAVLVRTNAQTALLETAFTKAQIPFRVKGGSSLLEQPEVQQALRDLRSARDDFAVALTDLETTAARARRRVTAAAGDASIEEALASDAAAELSPAASAADAERLANLEALVALAHDYATIELRPSVAGFASWLHRTTRADQPDRQGDAVDIATFHAAKGLEWPIVHLAGLEQGYVPIGHAQTAGALAEERRLFYVAVTRAERELHCTWAATRTFGTKAVGRDRSPYLDQVAAACEALARDEVPDDWAAHFRAARTGTAATNEPRADAAARRGATGDAVSDVPSTAQAPQGPAVVRAHVRSIERSAPMAAGDDDDPREVHLVVALARWRAAVARGASITPVAVMHDRTLRAIARARPRSLEELGAVAGLGPVKVRRYGDAILEIVDHHETAHETAHEVTT